jgi:DNA-directed RNA polymerase subunit RPC12/RpoP
MSAQNDNREITILESKGILIKDQMYHVVLTDRRIILTSFFDHKPRSINLPDVQKTEVAINDYGDPIIIVFAPSVAGEIKKVILHFSKKNFTDPRQVSSLWSSEINKMIQRIVPVSPDITPKVSPDITPKKGSPIPAFCLTCGTKFVDGSVFCNKCGSKIIYPVQPLTPVQEDNTPVRGVEIPVKDYSTPVQGYNIPVQDYNTPVRDDDIIKDEVITPEISMQKIELPPKKISPADTDDSDTREKVPLIASLPKERPKKKSFFAGSGKRKPAVVAVSALVCVIVVIAAFLVVLPSVSPGFNLTFPGMNSTVPESSVTASATVPLVPTTTIATTTTTPAVPEQTPVPEVPSAQPSLTPAPGDPSMVLVSYPSLFNAANGAGLSALLSENMKLYSSEVDSELATARSNGYSIEKIQVTNQIIEEDSAILDVAISWKVAGSPVTSTPRFFLVYENNQWKLDSLVVNPYVS